VLLSRKARPWVPASAKRAPFGVTFRLKSGKQMANILLLITLEIGVSAL